MLLIVQGSVFLFLVIYYRKTGGQGGVKRLVPIVVPTPYIAKRGPVTSLQARGGGVDQRDRIVLGSTLGPKKYILSWKSSKNKSMIRIGVVFRADSEFANENSRGAHLGPVFDDFRF